MTPRENVPQPPSTMQPASTADPWADRLSPEETALSTIWAGPVDDGSDGETAFGPPGPEIGRDTIRHQVISWLLTPTTRRRALVLTTVVALVCAGALAVGGINEGSAPGQPPTSEGLSAGTVASSEAALLSEAVDTEESAATEVTESPDGRTSGVTADSDAEVQRALSADERLALTAEALPTASGSWMLEAEIVDPVATPPIVVFSVNGEVLDEVSDEPYRLLLSPELVASSSQSGVRPGQPLIVTATARWIDGAEASSPATMVLVD